MNAANLTPALRQFILRMARNYGARDPEDVTQIVLMDMLEKPFLSEPDNTGALVQRIKHRTLNQHRSAKRRTKYELDFALREYGTETTDEASDGQLGEWEGSDWE